LIFSPLLHFHWFFSFHWCFTPLMPLPCWLFRRCFRHYFRCHCFDYHFDTADDIVFAIRHLLFRQLSSHYWYFEISLATPLA
jgi:hypothetical protein